VSSPVCATAKLPADHAGRRLAAWSLLAGIVLLAALAGPFFAGRVYTGDDLGEFHLPLRAFYAGQLARGQAYDWMPGLFSGFYLTGEGQAGVYHPLHQFLYRYLPLRAALGFEYLLPYPAMMLGMWLLLRRRLGRSDAAMFGALVFTFSSFMLLHFVHPNAVAVVAHIPLLLWTIDVALLDSRRRRVALASAGIALLTGSQLLLGYPQYVWFSLLAEVSYAAFLLVAYRYAARTGCDGHAACDACVGCAARTWPRVVIAKEVGLLLGSVQLLPTLDAWLHSARLTAESGYASWGSLHPLNLLQLVAPYLFTGRVVGGSTHELALYLGVVPLVLAVWAVARRRALGRLAPLAYAALGFAGLMLLLSFGEYSVVYRLIDWLPGLRTFRFPCRYIVLFQFAAAVMATIGLVVLTGESHRMWRQRRHGKTCSERRAWLTLWRGYEPLWCVVGVSAAVTLVGLTCRHDAYVATVPAILTGPLLAMAAVALVIAAARGYPAALVGLVLLAAADLGCYGLAGAMYPRNAPLEEYTASTQVPPGAPDGRILGSLLRFDQQGLRNGDRAVLLGWRRADGYAGLEPRKLLDYQLLPALRMAGVRWVRRDPSTVGIAGLKPRDDHWSEVPDPLPKVRLVTQTKLSREPDIDAARIKPGTTALVESPLSLPASTPGTAALVAECPGRLTVSVDCPAAQLLVVAESYHPGWQAVVDGQSLEVCRVNGDFLGCVVGPGKHLVELTFQPASLARGWFASMLGLGLVSLCFLGFSPPRGPKWLEDDLP
jgi:hypothetical protein